MHEKAIEKLNSLVVGALKNCVVRDSWFDWDRIGPHVQAVAKEVAKQKSEFVRERDAYAILSEIIATYIRVHSGLEEKCNGGLQDLIGEQHLLELANAITKYLAEIPHHVTAELEVSALNSDIETEKFIGKSTCVGYKAASFLNSPMSSGLGLLAAAVTKKTFYLRVTANGAASWSADSVTNRSMLSSLKILLHQAIDQNIVKIGESSAGLKSIFINSHQIAKASIKTKEEAIWLRENKIELPLEICILLEKLTFNDANEERANKLLSCLEVPAKLIESNSEESVRIKSAIEWSFDSITAEDETMAFLKACIGLEALLGENEAGPSLTETLSDRCSYLIATSIKSRKNIKERFKDLYKIRSNIVHGSINHLDRENRIQLEFARHFLRSAIRKEIQYILPQFG